MKTDFHRISRLPPYIFEQVNRLKAEARARGEDIIDFGMGNPDMPTPRHIVEKLIETARDPRANRYSASRGIKGLRRAMAAITIAVSVWNSTRKRKSSPRLARRKGSPILHRRSHRPAMWCSCPIPAYPIHAFGFILAGAAIRHVPANIPKNSFPRADTAIRHSQPSPLALVVNYPSNPDGPDGWQSIFTARWSRSQKVTRCGCSRICAYADTYFDDANPPPSILQVEGARISRSNSSRCRRPTRCPVGAWALRQAIGR